MQKRETKTGCGVEETLVALGRGFLAHPANIELREHLRQGVLSPRDFFGQLLRLMYRLIFLRTMENRGLVRSSARGSWATLQGVFRELAALGGLYAPDQCPALDASQLEDGICLAFGDGPELEPETFGSVYESLLERVPLVCWESQDFRFAGPEARGNARKASGSYYTVDSLVQAVLDQTLDPLIQETIARHPAHPVPALLELSIVDPACGSGHFLLAAARRLAKSVALAQGGEERAALRRVIRSCIYGVDVDPMAIELCRMSLWMEAFEPGLPLNFLNARIQEGNALLGAPQLTSEAHEDAFCAGFFQPRGAGAMTASRVRELAAEHGFFHWHRRFPEVMERGGFDAVIGNPPWDTLSPDAKEFFSQWDVAVRFQSPQEQAKTILRLRRDPAIDGAWERHCRKIYGMLAFLRESGRFTLFAPGNMGKGDLNLFRMFVELALSIGKPGAYAAQIVPEGLYNSAHCMRIRERLFHGHALQCILGFENHREAWFAGIDARFKFALYAARIAGRTEAFRVRFRIRCEEDLQDAPRQAFLIPVNLVEEFSPEALAVMEFHSPLDIGVARKMYASHPRFGTQPRRYMAELHMGGDRHQFIEDAVGIPVYEGRMVAAYDHRAKAYRSGRGRKAEWQELAFSDAAKAIQPQWYVREIPAKARHRCQAYRLGFCDVGSPTNERTLIAAIIPQGVICGHKVPTILLNGGYAALALWLAIANSFVMDFLVRKKVSLNVSYTVLDSLPFPRFHPAHARFLVPRVARLVCTGPEMIPFWNGLAAEGFLEAAVVGDTVPGALDEAVRMVLQAEIDAYVAQKIFQLQIAEVEHVLQTFPIVKRRDKRRYGEFRTRQLIVDFMAALVIQETDPLERI